jgi:hypothetical protein
MPHGAKLPVSDVSTPSLIGFAAAEDDPLAELDLPNALDPPKAAAKITVPTTAINPNRFTDLLLPSWPPYGGHCGLV